MSDTYNQQEGSAPFNMGIATLMSLRTTLDKIRDIEGRWDMEKEERQRIKIELTKRFYVDSAVLINDTDILKKYEYILDLEPTKIIAVDRLGKRTKRIVYSFELNKKLDKCLLNLQLELQKKKYFMPPAEDLSMSGLRMS